ncbi:MAG: ribonuclease Z [Candidatus Dormibacteraeota bacterium]|nr:ribonuclease Z [Candidatus Dormibacteraeota bacterium]
MRLAFLGTGSAFSLERYNGAVVVNGHILLDGGAPLLPHMHRLGLDPGNVEVLFLTHLHGDHVLGLPPFMLHRAFVDPRPFVVVGPAGAEAALERLFELCWGGEWAAFRLAFGLDYRVAEAAGEVAGVRYESLPVDHGGMNCRGYRLRVEGRVLAYAGDTIASPPLDELVRGADVAITEATSPSASAVHTAWAEAQALAARHPGTHFVFNHVFQGTLADAASDLTVVDA